MHYLSDLKEEKNLWGLFTKREEYLSRDMDHHGRFLYKYSHYKDAIDPVVSRYLHNKYPIPEYSSGKKFSIVITHDIDDIFVPWVHACASLLTLPMTRRLKKTVDLFHGKFDKKKSPYLNFKEIIKIEEKYGAKSSFYLRTDAKDPIRSSYQIEDINDYLEFIISKGFEVGLHLGYYSFNDQNSIQREKNLLEKSAGTKVLGVRNHYLRFNISETWALLAKAGFKYDTTFGYPDMIGFRNGMCHPFKPYDLINDCEINILEIPLNIMDATFFAYMKTDPNRAWSYAKQLIDLAEKFNGVLTILWHNTTFSSPYLSEWQKLFVKILHYGHEKKAWMTSGEEIYEWWKAYY